MTLRTYQVHIGLFLAVYVACLAHYWISNRSELQSPHWSGFVQDSASHQPVDTSRRIFDRHSNAPAQQIAAGQTQLNGKDAAIPGKEQTEPVTPLEHPNTLPDETRNEVSALSMQATSAAEPRERANAIVKLRNAARTDESVQALVSILAGDQSGQNRLFAIASLINMAKQGDEDGSVKSALRRAVSDQDPRVAARARQALEILSDVQVAAE